VSPDSHVQVFKFEGLTSAQATAQASSIIGIACELVRDGFHVSRDIAFGDVLLLKAELKPMADKPTSD
jgi:hypothetical protein